MSEQPLDLRRSLAILRRRWIALAAVAALGVAGGFVYAVRHVPEDRAVAEILLPATDASGADTTQSDTQTQVIIATSGGVLIPAAESVSPPIPIDQLQHAVSASAEGTNILRIEAGAGSSERAVQLVTAVTQQYQDYVKAHKAINGTTTVIEAPAPLPPSSTSHRVMKFGVLGLLAGLLVGIIIVLFRARPDRNLRQRDQIAGALGAPVLASMEGERYKSIGEWKRLLERFDASAMNAWTLRPVLRSLVPTDFDGQRTIRVVSFLGDTPALAAGPELALFAAGSGIPTRLAPSDSPSLEQLRAACAALRTSNQIEGPLSFGAENEPADGLKHGPARRSHDSGSAEAHLVVSVIAVDRSHPVLSAGTGPTILSVSSGFAAGDELARLSLAGTKAGIAIDGVVVVNPDPTDSTIGSLPDPVSSGWRAHGNNGGQGPGSTTSFGSTTVVRSSTFITGRSRWQG